MAVVTDETTTSLVFARWTLHGDGRLTGVEADIQLPPKEGTCCGCCWPPVVR